jgi:hypothetical protein
MVDEVNKLIDIEQAIKDVQYFTRAYHDALSDGDTELAQELHKDLRSAEKEYTRVSDIHWATRCWSIGDQRLVSWRPERKTWSFAAAL